MDLNQVIHSLKLGININRCLPDISYSTRKNKFPKHHCLRNQKLFQIIPRYNK